MGMAFASLGKVSERTRKEEVPSCAYDHPMGEAGNGIGEEHEFGEAGERSNPTAEGPSDYAAPTSDMYGSPIFDEATIQQHAGDNLTEAAAVLHPQATNDRADNSDILLERSCSLS